MTSTGAPFPDSPTMRLPLYTIYTASHEELYRDWFSPTIPSDLSLTSERLPFQGSDVYRSDAWHRAIAAKVDFIIAVIRMEAGRTFAFADADTQFFREFAGTTESLLGIADIVCQSESPAGTFCTGLFLCRSSSRVERLWQDVALTLKRRSSNGVHDQNIFNDIVMSRSAPVRCDYLPSAFMGGGSLTGRRWTPGVPLPIPSSVAVHHANFTVGVRNKVAQLQYVRQAVHSSATITDAEVSRIIRDWVPPPQHGDR